MMPMRSASARRMPEYFRMLAGILVAYVIIIGFGDRYAGGPLRIGVLGFLLWSASRLHANRQLRRWALGLAITGFVVTVVFTLTTATIVVYGVVGAWSTVLLTVAIGSIGSTLLVKARVDTATVLGVLCIYLLLALLFAGVHQVAAAFRPTYLNGAPDPPTPSDLLYFSVITMSTVGFGDLTPANLAARVVAVVEALTGQLYLVSVVAGVVGGWRAPPRGEPGPGGPAPGGPDEPAPSESERHERPGG
jgi:hypothetical protein